LKRFSSVRSGPTPARTSPAIVARAIHRARPEVIPPRPVAIVDLRVRVRNTTWPRRAIKRQVEEVRRILLMIDLDHGPQATRAVAEISIAVRDLIAPVPVVVVAEASDSIAVAVVVVVADDLIGAEVSNDSSAVVRAVRPVRPARTKVWFSKSHFIPTTMGSPRW
jgi:hypothetical protein